MGVPPVRAVVLVRFPFSDLTQAKLRPAVVLADVGREDVVLCQVTSKAYGDPRSVQIDLSSFQSGSLRVTSYVRPGKLFTANSNLITSVVGELTASAYSQVIEAVVKLLRP